MKVLYRWLANKILNLPKYENVNEYNPVRTMEYPRTNIQKPYTMYIMVHRAVSGYVVEFRKNETTLDKESSTSGLHIVTDDQDLGQEINRIMTYEMLR
jgi:hypothetical protein